MTGTDRRAERAAARRAKDRRGQAIAIASTVVVLGGLATVDPDQPGMARGQRDVLQRPGVPRHVPGHREGVLARHPRVLHRRGGGADPRPGRRPDSDDRCPGALPAAAARRRLHRRLPRHPHGPARLHGRLRRAGPGQHRRLQPRLAADRAGGARRDRADPVLRRLRQRGLPGRRALGPSRSARRGTRDRPHRAAGDAPRDPPAGRAQGGTAAAQRLHRAAEGRRSDRDHRGHRRGVPRGPDRRPLRTSTTRRWSPRRCSTWRSRSRSRGCSIAGSAGGRAIELRRAGHRAEGSDEVVRRARGPARDRPRRRASTRPWR